MKAGSGKQKGSAKERDLARKISLWISSGDRDDLVWRSASSGAVATIRSRSKKAGKGDYNTQVGDLCSIDPASSYFFSKVAIESKHYANLQFDNMVCGLKSKASSFWGVHADLCLRAGKTPWLIAKQNRKPDLLFTASDFFVVVGALQVNLTLSKQCEDLLLLNAVAYFPKLHCYVYVLDDFLNVFQYSVLFKK